MTPNDRKAYLKAYRQQYKQQAERWSITLTKSEADELRQRANKEGVKPPQLLKNMALAYHQQAPHSSASLEKELQETRFLFRNIANNINQIAYHSNTIRRLADENGLLREIQKLEQLVIDYFVNKNR